MFWREEWTKRHALSIESNSHRLKNEKRKEKKSVQKLPKKS
jgi:hypothetical protein